MNKEDKIKLSFVVPVYNMEKYLEACVESILLQNVEQSEIILVDDGSTDRSVFLCDKYAEQYENIKVIHKANGGISSARNKGLSVAQGDYICFVDSDDFFKKKFANDFLEICEKENLDIIRGWYSIYVEDAKTYQEHSFPEISYSNKTLSGCNFLKKSVLEYASEDEQMQVVLFEANKFVMNRNKALFFQMARKKRVKVCYLLLWLQCRRK